MGLHREGTNTILLATAIATMLAFLLFRFVLLPAFVIYILLAAIFVLWVIVVAFFRVPKRHPPAGANLILSPCDGKVVAIEKVQETEYFHDERMQVSIFMSPLNVHINFYPIGGTTAYYKYHPGKYLVAWHPKSSTENERSTVVVQHSGGKEVLFRQIAGALARRICTYAKVGEPAAAGTEFGFIKFGSRVDLLLPLDTEIVAQLGDVVSGATTTIAKLR